MTDINYSPTAGSLVGSELLFPLLNFSTDWKQEQIILSDTLSGKTKRLIFTWRNDYSIGTQPPVAIDNIKIISVPFLFGIYTIDNTLPTEGRNFNTFEEAVNALNTHPISDSVVFEVPAGRVFPVTLTNSDGLQLTASGTATQPITFRKRGEGANPLLNVTGTSNNSSDLCFYLNGTGYITFDGIDVENAGTLSAYNNNNQLEYAFYLANANNITINNSNIKLARSSYYTNYGIYTSGTVNSLHADNVSIGNTYYGIYTNGAVNSLLAENVHIRNANYGYYFYTNNTNTGNTISKSQIDSVSTGIYVYYYSSSYRQNDFTVKESKITNAGTGISLSYGNNQKIYNNVIHATSAGIYQYYSNTTDTIYLAHNTVYISATTNTAYCLYKNSSNGKLGLYNNIFVNKSTNSTSVCFYNVSSSDNSHILSGSNHNIYYHKDGIIYRNSNASIYSVAEYKALLGDGRESDSYPEDVPFISTAAPYDFNLSTTVPTKAESGGKGIAEFAVNTDIDGKLRNAATPDIGAYEFDGVKDSTDCRKILNHGMELCSNG